MKIGIFGLGFVGNAVLHAHQNNLNDTIIACDPPKGIYTTPEELLDCEAIFVCVPSPQKADGSCDVSILVEVLNQLKAINYRKGPIISKVTAPPAIYKKLQEEHENLVFAPEFLVAKTANEDYLNGEFLIVGGASLVYVEKAVRVISRGQHNLIRIKQSSIEEAAMAKYIINSFLSLKVAYLNQIFDLCKAENIDYNNVKHLIKLDESRLGKTHYDVPGPDTFRGFGGACFPKDTAAILYESNIFDSKLSILEEAINYNKTLREDIL